MEMNLDVDLKRKLHELGLYDLNEYQGWGNNFHKDYKDLNPSLNPLYKFIKKNKKRAMAEKMVNKLG